MNSTVTRPTIMDVARACGVSKTTVSYVINGNTTVNAHTRTRVLDVMREMNFHPSAVAQGLTKKKVHTIGVLFVGVHPVGCLTDPYSVRILEGIFMQCHRQGFNVTVFTETWQSPVVSGPPLRDGRTDGVIVVLPQVGSGVVETLTRLGIPVVSIAGETLKDVPMVEVDHFEGARLAAEHLVSLGHERIAYISGNADLASFAPRLDGFVAVTRSKGIEIPPEWIVISRFDGTLAYEQTKTLLQGERRPAAIIAGNDTIAFRVLEAAAACGIDVPGGLSVVGFDNHPRASETLPPLTTIHHPMKEIGAKAVECLIANLTGSGSQAVGGTILLKPELVIRQSTAAPYISST